MTIPTLLEVMGGKSQYFVVEMCANTATLWLATPCCCMTQRGVYLPLSLVALVVFTTFMFVVLTKLRSLWLRSWNMMRASTNTSVVNSYVFHVVHRTVVASRYVPIYVFNIGAPLISMV